MSDDHCHKFFWFAPTDVNGISQTEKQHKFAGHQAVHWFEVASRPLLFVGCQLQLEIPKKCKSLFVVLFLICCFYLTNISKPLMKTRIAVHTFMVWYDNSGFGRVVSKIQGHFASVNVKIW